MAKYSQEEKDAYLKYFRNKKKQGVSPRNIHTFSLWRKVNRAGGSTQTQKQLRGLSQSDADEIFKKFGRK